MQDQARLGFPPSPRLAECNGADGTARWAVLVTMIVLVQKNELDSSGAVV
jgi:hypothetical protein